MNAGPHFSPFVVFGLSPVHAMHIAEYVPKKRLATTRSKERGYAVSAVGRSGQKCALPREMAFVRSFLCALIIPASPRNGCKIGPFAPGSGDRTGRICATAHSRNDRTFSVPGLGREPARRTKDRLFHKPKPGHHCNWFQARALLVRYPIL